MFKIPQLAKEKLSSSLFYAQKNIKDMYLSLKKIKYHKTWLHFC